MKIGVVSDSHDEFDAISKAVKLFNGRRVELVVHCGDWVSGKGLEAFSKLDCPLKGVIGNMDKDLTSLGDAAKRITVELKKILEIPISLAGRKLVAIHGNDEVLLGELIMSKKYDVVFHGHTHRRRTEMINGVLVINPGCLVKDRLGVGWTSPSVAIYDSVENSSETIEI